MSHSPSFLVTLGFFLLCPIGREIVLSSGKACQEKLFQHIKCGIEDFRTKPSGLFFPCSPFPCLPSLTSHEYQNVAFTMGVKRAMTHSCFDYASEGLQSPFTSRGLKRPCFLVENRHQALSKRKLMKKERRTRCDGY